VVFQKFTEKVCAAFTVMPVKTGIQSLKFRDSESRHPGL
jgi:hypothetical protein